MPHTTGDDCTQPNQKSKIENLQSPEQQQILTELREHYGSDRAIAAAIRAALERIAVSAEELGKRPFHFPRTPDAKQLLRRARIALEALQDYVKAHLKYRTSLGQQQGSIMNSA